MDWRADARPRGAPYRAQRRRAGVLARPSVEAAQHPHHPPGL